MAEMTDKFYNMQVNLIKNGKIYAEKVAIKNVWKKDSNIFLDIYFHRLGKSFVFDAVFIHDIIDLNRDRYYRDINKFINDFNETATAKIQQKTQTSKKNNGVLSNIRNDLILLLFMSNLLGHKNPIKNKIICDYIQHSVEGAANFSDKYLNNYLASIKPSVDDFYQALKNIKSKNPEQALALLKEIAKICLSDGYLHYAEKMYLADIIQALRVEGLKIPQNLI